MTDDKKPNIEIEADESMQRWEINIWLADESAYCQVFVTYDGEITFVPGVEEADATS